MNGTEATILLVEDDEVDLQGMRRAFVRANITNPIEVAKDGIDALAKLRGEGGHKPVARPYITVLDLNLPRMNGIEFLEELRRDEKLKSSIVFVFTTSSSDEDRTKAYEKNVASYMVKSNSGNGYARAATLFEHYLRAVELP